MRQRLVTMTEVMEAARNVAADIYSDVTRNRLTRDLPVQRLFGVPRGGIPAALAVSAALAELSVGSRVVDDLQDADYIIDDLVDTGATRDRFVQPFRALFHKKDPAEWLVFPWEVSDDGHDKSQEDIVLRMLQAIGEDTTREGLAETPHRVTKAWKTWFSGYGQDPASVLKVFKDGAEGVDEMVLETDIPVYSFCEHHMAPIFGVAHVAYIPNGKVVGLSKLVRVVDIFARRLQVQERLTNQIADALQNNLDPKGVGVVLQCRHMCMESRGVHRHGVVTTTSALRGAIKDEHDARAEFLSLVGMSKSRHNPIL